MNQQTFALQTECPVCHKLKPEDVANEHDVVHLRWDYRKADRPKLEDKIPESPMCLECFNRLVDEWGPKMPWWDEQGNKHSAEEPNPKRIENKKFYERENNEIQEIDYARRLRTVGEAKPLAESRSALSRYRLVTLPGAALPKGRRRHVR